MAVSVPFRGFRGLQGSAETLDEWLSVTFQSPSGVLGVCRVRSIAADENRCRVSVPFRGFRGLQELTLPVALVRTMTRVSVPFRGFRGLQVEERKRIVGEASDGFSPLPGF